MFVTNKKYIVLTSILYFIHKHKKILYHDILVKVVVEFYSLEDIDAAKLDLYAYFLENF